MSEESRWNRPPELWTPETPLGTGLTVGDVTVFRQWRYLIVMNALLVLGAVGCEVWLVFSTAMVSEDWSGFPVPAVMFLVIGAVAFRAFGTSVVITPTQVLVRGAWRTQAIARESIVSAVSGAWLVITYRTAEGDSRCTSAVGSKSLIGQISKRPHPGDLIAAAVVAPMPGSTTAV